MQIDRKKWNIWEFNKNGIVEDDSDDGTTIVLMDSELGLKRLFSYRGPADGFIKAYQQYIEGRLQFH